MHVGLKKRTCALGYANTQTATALQHPTQGNGTARPAQVASPSCVHTLAQKLRHVQTTENATPIIGNVTTPTRQSSVPIIMKRTSLATIIGNVTTPANALLP